MIDLEITQSLIHEFFETQKKEQQHPKVFVSENELVLRFAFFIKQKFNNAIIHFEFPFSIECKRIEETEKLKDFVATAYLDLMVILNGKIYGFEFKYLTSKLKVEFQNYSFELKDHVARDVLRFGFRKDIHRLEYLKQKNPNHFQIEKGFAILLTNDQALKNTDATKNTLDKEFRFSENIPIKGGEAKWNNTKPSIWVTQKEYNLRLPLLKEYKIQWKNYHGNASNLKNSSFWYCIVDV